MTLRKKMKTRVGKMITRIAGTLAVLGAGMLELELHVPPVDRGVTTKGPKVVDENWRYRRIR